MKKCQFCAEEIQDEAIVCRFCGKDLRAGVAQPPGPRLWSPGIAGLLSFLIPGTGSMYKGDVGFGVFWFFLTLVGYVLWIIPGLAFHLGGIAIAASGDPTKPSDAPGAPSASIERPKSGPMHPAFKWVLGVMIGLALLLLAYRILVQLYGYEIREFWNRW